MSKFEYKEYAGKSKDERRELISSAGHLDKKRFLLSRDPILEERLEKLHKATKEFQKKSSGIHLFESVRLHDQGIYYSGIGY